MFSVFGNNDEFFPIAKNIRRPELPLKVTKTATFRTLSPLLIPVQAVILNTPLGGQVWWLGGSLLGHSQFETADVHREKTTRMTLPRTEGFRFVPGNGGDMRPGRSAGMAGLSYHRGVGF